MTKIGANTVDQRIVQELQAAVKEGPLSRAQLEKVAQHNGVGFNAVQKLYDGLKHDSADYSQLALGKGTGRGLQITRNC
jgi:hypothetical protein